MTRIPLRRSWTEDENAMVVRLVSEGKGATVIAIRLRRTTASVKARMRELCPAEDVACRAVLQDGQQVRSGIP